MAELPPLPPGFTLDSQQANTPPLPPGFTLDQPPGPRPPPNEPAQPGFVSRYLGNQPETGNTWGQATKNVLGSAAQLGTGIVGGLVGDVAGLGALAYDITANALTDPFGAGDPSGFADPAAVKERVANALTYQASPNSPTNAVLQAPGQAFGGSSQILREKVGNATDNPYLGSLAGALPIAVANYMGVRGAMPARGNFGGTSYAIPERVPGTPAPPEPQATPQQVAISKAREAGYKLAPDQVEAPVGKTVQGLAGGAVLERELSLKNAPITDALAKKAIGMDDKRALTPQTLQELRVKASEPYKEISKTGKVTADDSFRSDIAKIDDRSGAGSFAEDTPPGIANLKKIYGNKAAFDAGDAVAKIRQLRADARSNIKARNAPEQNALGYAQQKVADALDAQLARHVDGLGLGDLAKRYEAARVQLAKIHSVEDALQGANVSARRLSQQKARGAPLSAELKLIADTYDAFDRILQEPRKIRSRGPFSTLDAFIGAGGFAASPALAGAVLARPAARRFLASDLYQRRGISPKGKPAQKPVERKPNKAVIPATQQRERKAG